jgi:hypothetical protein
MKRISETFLVVIISTVLINGCEKDKIQNIKVDKDLVFELNNIADSIIVIDSHSYFLDVALWRDFMPISPPNGKPLISINWLICSDSAAIPSNIKLLRQYVINRDSIWIAEYLNNTRNTPVYEIEKISNNGPQWGPFIYVDVIAKIRDTNGNHDYYLKRSDVVIGRTD